MSGEAALKSLQRAPETTSPLDLKPLFDPLYDRVAEAMAEHFERAVDALRRPYLLRDQVKEILRITRNETLLKYERLGLPYIQIRPRGPHLYPRRALHLWLWKFAKGDPETLLEAEPDPTPRDLDETVKGWVADAMARST